MKHLSPRRYPILLALLVCALLPLGGCQLADMARFAYANANATTVWASEQHTTTVPFTLIDNHIVLPVRVNGSEPLNFVLDSGAATNVILDSRGSRALGLEMGAELPVSGVGTGPDPVVHAVSHTSLEVGDVSLAGLSVIYLPLESIPFFDDLDQVYFDGVIGAPFFSRFTVTIDYDLRLVSFSEPSADKGSPYNPEADWREVPLQIDAGVPYMTAQVSPAAGQAVAVKLLVDTGFRGAFSLTPATHADLAEPALYFDTVNQGLSGDVMSRMSVSDSLVLADYTLRAVPTSYAIAGGESDSGSNGILGNTVLRQFNLVFDYANQRLLLTPNRSFEQTIAVDRSGLQLRPHAHGAIIKDIASGSAASSSSLQVGEVITSFADTPVTYETVGELKRTLASARDSVRLCWSSGPEQRCEELVLAARLGAQQAVH